MNASHAPMLINFLRTPPAGEDFEPILEMTVDQAGNVAAIIESLQTENLRLREKTQAQRRELRRLNQSIIDKMHRLEVSQARVGEGAQLLRLAADKLLQCHEAFDQIEKVVGIRVMLDEQTGKTSLTNI